METIVIHGEGIMIRSFGEVSSRDNKLTINFKYPVGLIGDKVYRVEMLDRGCVFMGRLSKDRKQIVEE